MNSFLNYIKDLDKQEKAFIKLKSISDCINAVFMACFEGKDVGLPEMVNVPMTTGMAEASRDFEKATTLIEKDRNNKIIMDQWKKIFESITNFKRDLPYIIIEQLKRIDKNRKKTLIPHRNFQHSPECAQIIRTLLVDYSKEGATFGELAHEFPEHAEVIDKKIDKIQRIWPGLVIVNRETEKVRINSQEFNDFRTLIHDFNGITTNSVRGLDETRAYFGMILYSIYPTLKDEQAKLFVREEWGKFVNKRLNEYPALIPKKISGMLMNHGINCALDFLKQDYFWMKSNVPLTKEMIIDIYLGLASRLKYDCKDFPIEILHKSAFLNMHEKDITDGLYILYTFFDNKKLKYKDILNSGNIYIESKEVNKRSYAYRIIAFIRWFYMKCRNGGITFFEPLGEDWDFKDNLTAAERKFLKIKKNPNKPLTGSHADINYSTDTQVEDLQELTKVKPLELAANGGSKHAKE